MLENVFYFKFCLAVCYIFYNEWYIVFLLLKCLHSKHHILLYFLLNLLFIFIIILPTFYTMPSSKTKAAIKSGMICVSSSSFINCDKKIGSLSVRLTN